MSYRIRVAQPLKLNVEPVYALIATQGLPVAQRGCQGWLEDSNIRQWFEARTRLITWIRLVGSTLKFIYGKEDYDQETATLRVYHAFCRGAFDCRTGRENHHRWNGKWFLNSAGTQRSV